MKFEWDINKNEINKIKHGISFEEACEIFTDPLQISIMDERFNYYDERWITIGRTYKHMIVIAAHLVYDESGEETIRIISARKATSKERSQYEG